MLKKQYIAAYNIFYVYWKIYGGAPALFLSPYFHVSLVIALLSYPLWKCGQDWPSITFSVIPSILGFSIGAFAIILTFGEEAFKALRHKVEIKSKYLGLVAAFLHFIIMQALAILVAVLGKAWPSTAIGLVGFVLFVYSVSLSVAAAVRVFRLARVYNQMKDEDKSPEES